MGASLWLDGLTVLVGFAFGMTAVHKLSQGSRRRAAQAAALNGNRGAVAAAGPRPQQQVALLGIEPMVATTDTSILLGSIERRTRLSAEVFRRDCRPVLETFADFVTADWLAPERSPHTWWS